MLEIRDLKLSIDGTQILKGVTTSIAAGQTVGVIGPNGSGKTTLFNCLSGFHTRVEGHIIFKEMEITLLEAHERARLGIGRVFQNFGVFREMTLVENLLTALEAKDPLSQGIWPWSNRTKLLRAQSLEYLRRVKLDGMATKRAEQLSGGQMRLLEIIRAVAFGAELFLLDEPTAGVSPKMKEEVAGQIMELKKAGKTILVIEHDLNFIQQFCERILVLDEGRIVMDGTPESVRSDPRLQEIYFGKAA